MQQQYILNDILSFEQRFRAAFINSLGGFKSLVLIGSIGGDKLTNLAPFSSLVHLGANPPLFALIVRPDSVERHTLENILDTGEFTVNHVREEFYQKAHQCSARYPKEVSEFDATGLTAEYFEGFAAPFVAESHIKIGAKLVRQMDIQENGTIMLIASIERVLLPKECIAVDGFVDIESAGTITCSGLDSYHGTKRLARLSYAKPDQQLSEISK